MPSTLSRSPRTIGAGYLAAAVLGDDGRLDEYHETYSDGALLTALLTQAKALALRVAGHEQTSVGELLTRLVAAAALRDQVERS